MHLSFLLLFTQEHLAQFPVGTVSARFLLVQLTFIALLHAFKIFATQEELVLFWVLMLKCEDLSKTVRNCKLSTYT